MRTSATAAFLVVASIASQVSATIFVTEPVASTICTANVPCNVRWNDDGTAPFLTAIGACRIELCTGGQFQQTCLQTIAPSLDVSQNAFVTYNPEASVGPTGAFYFIKYTSLALPDAANPSFPFTAFSSRFTLNGMTGTFNATVQAQVTGSGGIAAPAATSAAPAAAGSSTPAAAASRTSAKPSASGSAVTSPKPTQSSGAIAMTAPNVVSSVTGMTVFAGFFSVFLGMLAFGL